MRFLIINSILLLLNSNMILCQDKNLVDLIDCEHKSLNKLFKDKLFLDIIFDTSSTFDVIGQKELISTVINGDSFSVMELEIQLNKALNGPSILYPRMNYYFLVSSNMVFRLFGFFCLDIYSIADHFGASTLKQILALLRQKDLFSKKDHRLLWSALTNNARCLPKEFSITAQLISCANSKPIESVLIPNL